MKETPFLCSAFVFSFMSALTTRDVFNVFLYVFVVGSKDGAAWASCPSAASRVINQNYCEVCVTPPYCFQRRQLLEKTEFDSTSVS